MKKLYWAVLVLITLGSCGVLDINADSRIESDFEVYVGHCQMNACEGQFELVDAGFEIDNANGEQNLGVASL